MPWSSGRTSRTHCEREREVPCCGEVLFWAETYLQKLQRTTGGEESSTLYSFTGESWSSRHASAPIHIVVSRVEPLSVVCDRWPTDHIFHKRERNINHQVLGDYPNKGPFSGTACGKANRTESGWCLQGRVASPVEVPASLQKSKMLSFF